MLQQQQGINPTMYQIMNPAFHRATPVGMFGSLMPKVFRLVEEQPTVPVLELMQKLTLDALGKSVFGKVFSYTLLEIALVIYHHPS